MTKLTFSTITAVAIAAVALGMASPAFSAPSESASAQDTIKSLEAAGYTVILNKIGPAPLTECIVTEVRPGREITQRQTDSTDSGSRSVDTVVHRSVYVFASC